jgi:hypothetical protein
MEPFRPLWVVWKSSAICRTCAAFGAALGRYACDILSKAGLHVKTPQGAFHLFLDFSPFAAKIASLGIRTGRELCDRLLEDTGVALLSGAEAGRYRSELLLHGFPMWTLMEQPRLPQVKTRLWIRLCPNDFLAHDCPRVIEGLSRIAWRVQNPGA